MPDIELALLIDRFMRKIHFSLQAKSSSFDKYNVGPGGGIVLLTLAEMENPTIQQLTSRVSRDKSQMTRIIQSFQSKGLIERKPYVADARASVVCLTNKGEAVVEELKAVLAEKIDHILKPLHENEKETVKKLMKQILD